MLDDVGGDNIERSLPSLKKGGTLISIPTGLSEDVTLKASDMGINAYFFLVQSNEEDISTIAEMLKSGTIKPHVSAIFPFEQIEKEHAEVGSNRAVGKVVVRL